VRKRWQENFERLTIIEGSPQSADLEQAILDLLADEQRSGRPPTFTAEQLTMIFAVACEAVEDSGRPVARWTQREIADEVVKRGIVKSISLSHLSTLLAEAQLQPHKSRYWLNTKEKDPEVFKQQMQTVCDCYQQAPEQLDQHDTHTVCMDEMTSIQAQPVVVCSERRNCLSAPNVSTSHENKHVSRVFERIAPPKKCGLVRKNASSSNTNVTARSA